MKLQSINGNIVINYTSDSEISEFTLKFLHNAYSNNIDNMPMTFIVVDRNNMHYMLASNFENNDQKNILFDIASAMIHTVKARLYIVASEIWFTESTKGNKPTPPNTLPSESKDKKEGILLLSVSKTNKVISKFLEITRKGNTITLDERDFSFNNSEGNLVSLFTRFNKLDDVPNDIRTYAKSIIDNAKEL